jgi:hypothetical protein
MIRIFDLKYTLVNIGKNGFDISFHFELNIPGFGITDGEWWRSQFYEYLVEYVNEQNQ